MRHFGYLKRVVILRVICSEKGWGSLGSIVGGQGARARANLVLRECIWNAPVDSLLLPAFEDTGSLSSPPRPVVYPPGSNLDNCLPFPCRE